MTATEVVVSVWVLALVAGELWCLYRLTGSLRQDKGD